MLATAVVIVGVELCCLARVLFSVERERERARKKENCRVHNVAVLEHMSVSSFARFL